jgi:thiol-disulfide isomerase/thioredoxin
MNTRRSLVITFIIAFLCATALAVVVTATTGTVKLYYYSAENCPHCKEYGPLIHQLAEQAPTVTLIEKDIWLDRSAFEEMMKLVATHGDLPVATPTLFLGNKVWIGLDHNKLREVEAQLKECLESGCPDAMERLLPENSKRLAEQPLAEEGTISVPLWGELDAREISLPLVTLTLGLLDSINPCAFFVLLFLLSLMIHAHSRMRMLTVGVVFVSFSGLIYFLFMAAWLNLFLATGGIRVVTLLAGFVALLIGGFNVKDYFMFHKGPSLSIPEKAKPGLYHRVRGLVKSANYLSLLGGTALLAIAANSYELLCTAGFPMVFTRILTLQELPTWQYYTYLGLYNVVYVIPLLIIVIIFAVTLGAHQLSERQGRCLKLVSGIMMAVMGLVLVFFPTLLQSLSGTITIFSVAMLCIAIILFVSHYRQKKRKP